MDIIFLLLFLFLGLGLALMLFGFIAQQPSTFRVERSAVMDASPAIVFAEVNDFQQWNAWSPWAKIDGNAKTSYEGTPSGVGAIFRWEGNRAVGVGSMTILESQPNENIVIQLDMLRPFVGTNTVQFTFQPEGEQTKVTWALSGKQSLVGKVFSLFKSCDAMVGSYYEKGLAQLKAIVEAKA